MILELDGVISFLMTRRPIVEEVRDYNKDSGRLHSITSMTSNQVWEPYSKNIAERREEEARTISLLSTVKKKTIAEASGGEEPPAIRKTDGRDSGIAFTPRSLSSHERIVAEAQRARARWKYQLNSWTSLAWRRD
jgi:hypothetical protein